MKTARRGKRKKRIETKIARWGLVAAPAILGKSALVLALDIGTSSVRAALYDHRGDLYKGSERVWHYHPKVTHDGHVEVNANWLLGRVAWTIDRVFEHFPSRKTVLGVGISTFWHSMLGVDKDRRALTPVLLWADTRSADEVPYLMERIKSLEGETGTRGYHQRTGTPLHPCFLPAKLCWYAHHEPKIFVRVRQWTSFAEYVFIRLFGTAHCSVSMASGTGLWNHKQQMWDQPILSICSISSDQLMPVSDEPFKGLRPNWARRWHQLADAFWFPSYGDGACANVGVGAIQSDQLGLTVGTSSALRTIIPANYAGTLPPSLWRYAVDENRHIIGGALSEGGNVYRWLLDMLRFQNGRSQPGHRKPRAHSPEPSLTPQLTRNLARMAPDSHGLTFLPFLAGERSPGWRAESRAMLAGVQLATHSLDIVRAGLEAVALRLAAIYDDLCATLSSEPSSTAPRPGSVIRDILAGGAALENSSLWTQIIADAFGTAITRSAVKDSSARGAALLVWERLTGRRIEEAAIIRRDTFQPSSEATTAYHSARLRQTLLYEKLVRAARLVTEK